MPRPRCRRRIRFIPGASHFAPVGSPLTFTEEITLTLDEFEAIRLKDFKNLDQEKAAQGMGISQPTFSRLLEEARKKVADALVNNKTIKIKGGNYEMVTQIEPPISPGMGRARGAGFARGGGRGMRAGRAPGPGPVGTCICPVCGTEQPKVPALPCTEIKCKKCGSVMVRK